MRWLSAPELAGLPGLPGTARSVLRRAQAEAWRTRSRSSGRGRAGLEYWVSDLPPQTQLALAARATGAVKPATDAHAAGQRAAQAEQVQACALAMAKHGIALEAQGAFDAACNPKLDVLQRLESYHGVRGGAVCPAIQEFVQLWGGGKIEAHANTRTAYPTLVAKTVERWYHNWRTQGVEALLERKPRSDKGQTRLADDAELHEAFLGVVAEMHQPTTRQVQRVIREQLGQERTPPLSTLKRWLRTFRESNAPALLLLRNPDAYKSRYRPAFGSQTQGITRPNQLWEQDSTIGDAQQRADLTLGLVDVGTGEIRRHAIIASMDVFTRRAQVVVAPTSSANAVKAVTRRCILAWGKPELIKTDNGKDYTAEDFDFALRSLGIEHALCTPFSPEQKPHIERFIGTLMHDLFPMLEGFVGRSVAERKAIESAKSFAQRFGLGGVDLRMGARELQEIIDRWLDEYHARTHSELGCSPNEMAQRHTTHVIRLDERALDIFLMAVAGKGTRVVGKRGISLGNAWFTAPALAAHIGSAVRCRQDDLDLGALHVFALDGSYICRALDYTMLGINRAELAAKAHAIEAATIKPMVDRLRKAAKRGLTRQAVQTIYRERQQEAIAHSSNVSVLPARVVEASTPQVASVLAHLDGKDDGRAQALAMLEEAEAPVRPGAQGETVDFFAAAHPGMRYSNWLRLHALTNSGGQLSAREVSWMQSYQQSSEWAAWDELHGGADPLAQANG